MNSGTFLAKTNIAYDINEDPNDKRLYRNLLKAGGVRGRDVEYEDGNFPHEGRGRYSAVFEIYHHVVRENLGQVIEMIVESPMSGHACATWLELLTFHARHGKVRGLKRLIAPGQLWRRPNTVGSLVYAPALYYFPDQVYLGLARLDERPWLPEYGVLVRKVDK